MQQRRLRLGDILDDYCPRERRITNHAVVAMIEDEVRQTRCLTCDTEHEFRQGKAPTLRKKKDNVATAYPEVLAERDQGRADAVAADAREPLDSEPPADGGCGARPGARGRLAAAERGREPDLPRAAPPRAEGGEGAEEEGAGPSPPDPRDAAAAREPGRDPSHSAIHHASAQGVPRSSDRRRRAGRGRLRGPGWPRRAAAAASRRAAGRRSTRPGPGASTARGQLAAATPAPRQEALEVASSPPHDERPGRQDGPDRRRRQQAIDRLGDRAGGGRGRRAARPDLPGRAARGERRGAGGEPDRPARAALRRHERRADRRALRARRPRSSAASTSSCTAPRSRPARS